MSSQSSSCMSPLPKGTDIFLDECFPIDDAPARSVHCMGWGPHNVLQVCSRWTVTFFLASLLAPACQRQIRHHPLCHRDELESVEVIVGAKWSTALLPEVFYPASARLCVQTTSNLVVYRVTRHGSARVEVSCGIGIACYRGGMASFMDAQDRKKGRKPSASTCDNASNATAASDQGEAKQSKRARPRDQKPSKEARSGPSTKKAAPSRQRRRRETSSTSSSSTSSSSGSSTSDGSESDSDRTLYSLFASEGGAGPSRGASKAGSDAATTASRATDSKRGRRCADESTCGIKRQASEEGLSSSASPSSSRRATGATISSATTLETDCGGAGFSANAAIGLLDYVWLDNDDLVILSTRGLHVVSFYGDLSDDDSPQVRDLPPPVYLWNGTADAAALGFWGPTPVCFAPISAIGLATQVTAGASALGFLHRTLVAASPYLLRVLHVSPAAHRAGSLATAQLVQFMELPSLASVPSAVCAVGAGLKSSVAAPSHQADAVEVVVFLAAPSLLLRGRFVLSVPFISAASAPSASRATTWLMDAQFGPDHFVGEVGLRGLLVAPFSADQGPAPLSDGAYGSSGSGATAAATSSATLSANRTLSVAVLGIGDRSLFQYSLSGPSCVTLIQCPLMAGLSEMIPRKCAGFTSVALHPSGAVAVTAVQSGQPNLEPMHLWPVSADGPGSWLNRLVEFSGILRNASEAPTGGSVNRSGQEGTASARRGDTGGSLCTIENLIRCQVRDTYILRECVLSGSVTQCGALHRYARLLQGIRSMPSTETLKKLRALTLLKNATESPSSLVLDLALRHLYLQLRAQHGVVLFLRWPLPMSAGSGSDGQGCPSGSALAPVAVLEAEAASWPWWRLLRHIWSTCPWDTPVLSELILSNAVQILAKRYRYANMAFAKSERFRESARSGASTKTVAHMRAAEDASTCATDPDTVDIDGARCYIEAYVRQHEELLCSAASKVESAGPHTSSITVLTAADCKPVVPIGPERNATLNDAHGPTLESVTSQVHWCVSQTWVTALKDFLVSVADEKTVNASTSSLSPTPSSSAAVPTSLADPKQVRFPCSLCDRKDAATFHLSLSSTSRHVPFSVESEGDNGGEATSEPPATHTTLFSGTTFSPLSLFSPDYVLTRCLSCGLGDYAVGPLCRVCGGLLE